jgi:hypothetical protein
MSRIVLLVLATGVLMVETTIAQARDSARAPADTTDPWYDTAWSPIVERGGVQIGYIFYGQADNENNGVVLRLENQNEYPVRYDFTVLFRGPAGRATAQATGRLAPGEMKTGEKDGLFWIPFRDGRRVGRVGLRGIDITPLADRSGLRN